MRQVTAFEAHLLARLSRAREHIPLAHLAEFDAVLAHARDGHHGWTMLWSSLSPAQRRLMSALCDAGGKALRIATRGVGRTSATGQGVCSRVSTIRALARRGLLDWAEPTHEKEWVVTASDKGRSLLAALRTRA